MERVRIFVILSPASAGVPARSELYTSAYILRSADYWDEVIEGGKKFAELGKNNYSEFELNLAKHLEDLAK